MTNLNSEILNWIQFAKGDVMGHEFHGNQHVSAQQVSDAQQTATSAKHLAIAAREGVKNPRQGRLTPDGTYVKGFSERELNRLGALHASAEMEHRQMSEDTTGMVSRMHDQAATAHAIASDTAHKEAEKVKNDPYSTDSQMHVALASEEAAGQSRNALTATKADFNKGEKSSRVAKADKGRYTEITVSEPNLTDWQHQGWNGPGKDNILDGDDSSEESSSENMYGGLGDAS